MNKTLLIISREYLSRVRKKSFIIMTFLGPLLISGIWLVPIWLGSRGVDEKKIQVFDESGLFAQAFEDSREIDFEIISGDLEERKQEIRDNAYDGLLFIPDLDIYDPGDIMLFTESSPGIELTRSVERILEEKIEAIKLEKSGIAREDLDKIKTNIRLNTINLTSTGEEESNTGASLGAGFLFTFMIYMFIFVYGVQVMRGVIEEKSNKIVEVIISSVRPFQLMLGKIMGVAAVVITQLLLWILLSTVIIAGVVTLTGFDPSAASDPEAIAQRNELTNKFAANIMKLNIGNIVGAIVVYFFGGYLHFLPIVLVFFSLFLLLLH
jgi:ABC-2 type transport system permease protein